MPRLRGEPSQRLTPREFETLYYIRTAHLTDREIAVRMGIKRRTVRSFVSKILAKKKATSRRELL